MRTISISESAGFVQTVEGHGQTLKKFLGTFRDSIVSGYRQQVGLDIRLPAMKIYTRPYLDSFDPVFGRIFSAICKSPSPRDRITHYLQGVPIFKSKSPFWHRRTAAYVIDVMQHLQTQQALSNRRFLHSAAFATWDRNEVDFGEPVDATLDYSELIKAVNASKSSNAIRHLKETIFRRIQRPGYEAGLADSKEFMAGILAEVEGLPAEEKSKVVSERIKELRSKESDIQSELRDLSSEMMHLGVACALGTSMISLIAVGVSSVQEQVH